MKITGTTQNGPRRLKQIKALHWQTPARGSFDHQRLFGALANRITLKTPIAISSNGLIATENPGRSAGTSGVATRKKVTYPDFVLGEKEYSRIAARRGFFDLS